MGWFFNRTPETPTQQFGASNSAYGMAPSAGMGSMGGAYGGMQNGMMDPYAMQQMQQNPFMQQMANDPVIATSRLLDYYDPMGAFIVSTQFPVMMDLMAELITLSLKDFFQNVRLTAGEDGAISLDVATLPSNIATLSPENLSLTLGRLVSSAQNQIQINQQGKQMLLQAHNPMMNNQPGFFGSVLGGLLGNQMQQQGGLGAMGMGAAALV